jgi:uncharacterized membrane protein (DUF4010 family)
VQETLLNLALALAVGLIVGIERGWQERAADEGSRIAGVRTFGLIGLMGGLCELLAGESRALFGFAFFAFALVMAVAHFVEARADRDYGITTVVASLMTFILGALAVHGDRGVAAAGAVVVATLLNLKPVLHRWLEHIEAAEIRAALKLLLISIVVLPILPDKGYGPWNALNPYEIWWLVVLIAAISFAAYVAVKAAGPKHGILLTALLGAMVSSTGVTIQLSRLSKTARDKSLTAAGILVASAIMFVRVLIVVAIINRDLARLIWLPCAAMALPLFGAAVLLGRRNSAVAVDSFKLRNPVEILQAVQFAAILSGILLFSKAMQEWFGQAGLYVVAVASGLADVDAISVSVARTLGPESAWPSAARAVMFAAMTNTLTKGVLAQSIGGTALGTRVIVPVVLALTFGGVALWLL